jgi:predicted DNA-binding transcriptional regulator AlpA
MSMTAVEDAETGRIDRRLGREVAQPLDPYGRFLKLADVMDSIGVSQAMVYKLMHDERLPFPRPVKIGRVSVWIERDVVHWKAIVAGDLGENCLRDASVW